MVARGDLGIRLPLEDVPFHQKEIIRCGVRFARPVITATQMLESMITSPVPTRAEVSDVANAVLDGTSAVMLSGETAIGADPARAVSTMASIVERAEREFDYVNWGAGLGVQEVSGDAPLRRITAAITGAAWHAALEEDVAAIIACTHTGATARAISRFRPSMPIVAVTPHERTAPPAVDELGRRDAALGASRQHRRRHLARRSPGGRGRIRLPGRRRRRHRRVALRTRSPSPTPCAW